MNCINSRVQLNYTWRLFYKNNYDLKSISHSTRNVFELHEGNNNIRSRPGRQMSDKFASIKASGVSLRFSLQDFLQRICTIIRNQSILFPGCHAAHAYSAYYMIFPDQRNAALKRHTSRQRN